jgi:hypothetical protein
VSSSQASQDVGTARWLWGVSEVLTGLSGTRATEKRVVPRQEDPRAASR